MLCFGILFWLSPRAWTKMSSGQPSNFLFSPAWGARDQANRLPTKLLKPQNKTYHGKQNFMAACPKLKLEFNFFQNIGHLSLGNWALYVLTFLKIHQKSNNWHSIIVKSTACLYQGCQWLLTASRINWLLGSYLEAVCLFVVFFNIKQNELT